MLQFRLFYGILIDMIKGIISFLVGKKTYIVGALMIALGLLQGDNQMVLTGLGFITLRIAV